uniref:(salmon louse) hypothetical protein n=1 Tax=Lepeophtheirus salmonis TaxID=72036 RepID=A0A7R8H2J1_LEPSM
MNSLYGSKYKYDHIFKEKDSDKRMLSLTCISNGGETHTFEHEDCGSEPFGYDRSIFDQIIDDLVWEDEKQPSTQEDILDINLLYDDLSIANEISKYNSLSESHYNLYFTDDILYKAGLKKRNQKHKLLSSKIKYNKQLKVIRLLKKKSNISKRCKIDFEDKESTN